MEGRESVVLRGFIVDYITNVLGEKMGLQVPFSCFVTCFAWTDARGPAEEQLGILALRDQEKYTSTLDMIT